jgi:segregation and condensation protein A
MAYRVRLEMFEGPLDLLLYLIQVNQIDIYDIPIARITAEYLACLATMRELDLDVAGEFLVLAATLIHIKSRMLLPRDDHEPAPGDDQDPRQELVDQLLHYRRFREAAMTLEEREARQHLLYARRVEPLPASDGPLEVSLADLIRAFAAVMERAPKEAVVEIRPDAITVSQRMVTLLDRLARESPVPFTACFEETPSRPVLIATFLALLELLRQGLVRARQVQPDGEIVVYRHLVAATQADNGHGT